MPAILFGLAHLLYSISFPILLVARDHIKDVFFSCSLGFSCGGRQPSPSALAYVDTVRPASGVSPRLTHPRDAP